MSQQEKQVSFVGVSKIFSKDRKILLFAQRQREWVFPEWFPVAARLLDTQLLGEAWRGSLGAGEQEGPCLSPSHLFS